MQTARTHLRPLWGHGLPGGYSGSHGPCAQRNPHFHGRLQGVWACGKHPRTLEQQPRLWEKALQTRTSVTAKTGDHQQAAGRSQKPASVAGLCCVLCAGRMGWPRAGPEELSTGKNMGEPGKLRSHPRRMAPGSHWSLAPELAANFPQQCGTDGSRNSQHSSCSF